VIGLTRAGYATSKQRLQEFCDLVEPWHDRASVTELDERWRSYEPGGRLVAAPPAAPHVRAVVFDVGETLIDETTEYGSWRTGSGSHAIPSAPCSARSSPVARTTGKPSSTFGSVRHVALLLGELRPDLDAEVVADLLLAPLAADAYLHLRRESAELEGVKDGLHALVEGLARRGDAGPRGAGATPYRGLRRAFH
jgi:hypothetical protein